MGSIGFQRCWFMSSGMASIPRRQSSFLRILTRSVVSIPKTKAVTPTMTILIPVVRPSLYSKAASFSTSALFRASSFSFHAGHRELRDLLTSQNLMGDGSVDLEMDETTRIATVTLNHPARR